MVDAKTPDDVKWHPKRSLLLPLAVILLLTILLVPPVGDFPLNDDWIYGKTVQNLIDTGTYQANPYADPTFIAQAYWGALISKLFGFSYTTLRISTLVLTLLAAWAGASCARVRGLNRAASLTIGVLLLANPLVLNLSYTFMTDIPFLAVSTLSAFFYLKALRDDKARYIALGSTVAVVAFFIRQFGLLVPLAYAATITLLLIRHRKPIPWQHAAAFLIPWTILPILLLILPDLPSGAGAEWDWNDLGNTTYQRATAVIDILINAAVYLSLFTLPIFFAAITLPKSLDRKRGAAFVLLAAFLAFRFIRLPDWQRLPGVGNMLYDLGIGPMLLRGSVVKGEILSSVQLGAAWWPLIVLCLLSTATFLWQLPRRDEAAQQKGVATAQDLFLILWGLAMLFVIALPAIPIKFDRYFITALVPCSILMLNHAQIGISKRPTIVAATAIAGLYLFSLAALQDYMAWNTARWTALDRLESEYHATPETIDGGYEYEGLHHSDLFVTEDGQRAFGPRGWWLIDDLYAVSLHPRKNFEQIETQPYFTWLGMQSREVLLLKRTGEPEQIP